MSEIKSILGLETACKKKNNAMHTNNKRLQISNQNISDVQCNFHLSSNFIKTVHSVIKKTKKYVIANISMILKDRNLKK